MPYMLVTIPKSPNGMTRLIPRTISHGIEEGLQARVADPLWMLTRQRQTGEFRARNGGSLVRAKVSGSNMMVDGLTLDSAGAAIPVTPSGPPWEPLVEAESSADHASDHTPPSWNPTQLEYRFVAHIGPNRLSAAGYHGGRVDWYSFDSSPLQPVTGSPLSATVFPLPVSFPGAPVSRWWKFEDRTVDLGDIRRPNLDYVSMLLTEFALVYANDWFVIPVQQPVGSIRIVNLLTVVDTFGKMTEISPIRDDSPDERRWSLFTLSGAQGSNALDSKYLLLPNTAAQVQKGTAIEEVRLCRDELANLVWAVEETYSPDPLSPAVHRDDDRRPVGFQAAPGAFLPIYRLKSEVPPHWVPYVPVRKDYAGSIILRRGRTDASAAASPEGGQYPDHTQYKGRILHESRMIYEEEVPAGPVVISRLFKRITVGQERWSLESDGTGWRVKKSQAPRAVIWLGRMKKRGPRTGASGLTFDYLIERASEPTSG